LIATSDAARLVAARLAAAGLEDARREARLILAAAHGVDATGLLLLDELDETKFEPMVQRREAREPLAYILGRREFWGLIFEVSQATLIPRPDSETIVEAALAACPAPARVLDLGTGTGCLLLAVLHERQGAFGVGVDLVPEAAALAARNARRLGMAKRAAFMAGDWAAALNGRFDLVLSNPPYISCADIADLMPEVAQFEPRSALDGGPDGLAAYRHIIGLLPGILSENGVAVLELGVGQAPTIVNVAALAGFSVITTRDLGGIERAAVLKRCK
jgi:release factor glutamine methyltransferase